MHADMQGYWDIFASMRAWAKMNYAVYSAEYAMSPWWTVHQAQRGESYSKLWSYRTTLTPSLLFKTRQFYGAYLQVGIISCLKWLKMKGLGHKNTPFWSYGLKWTFRAFWGLKRLRYLKWTFRAFWRPFEALRDEILLPYHRKDQFAIFPVGLGTGGCACMICTFTCVLGHEFYFFLYCLI